MFADRPAKKSGFRFWSETAPAGTEGRGRHSNAPEQDSPAPAFNAPKGVGTPISIQDGQEPVHRLLTLRRLFVGDPSFEPDVISFGLLLSRTAFL